MREDLPYRTRFELTLSHRPTDRVPIDLAATDMTDIEGGPRTLAPLLGIPGAADDEATDEAVLRALDVDIRCVGGILVPLESQARRLSPTEIVDAWGIRSRWNGHHYEAVGRPLEGADVDTLRRYPWPDPEKIDRAQIRAIADRARYLHDRTPYVVCARHPVFGVLELGCWMCGFDDFLYRLAADPVFVHELFGILLAYQMRVNEIYYGALGRTIHFTTSGDDFGSQTGPLLSPRMFREMVLPYLTRRIRHVALFNDAAFFHHSCGSILPLIQDLVDAGVRILNPIQPRTRDMEPARLRNTFGRTLTFHGGVDTQLLLPRGTPDEVTAATRELIRILGSDGGYILAAAHTLQADVPRENILAMYRAALSTGDRPPCARGVLP